MSEAPRDVRDLAVERAERRVAKDFTGADELRDRITALGWTVVDEPGGWRLERVAQQPSAAGGAERARPPTCVRAGSAATADFSMHWVVEGWPEDVVERSRRSDPTRARAMAVRRGRRHRTDPAFGDGVEVARSRRAPAGPQRATPD